MAGVFKNMLLRNISDYYMVELDTPWVSETIDEKFDGAPELITDRSVIYGGIIRDILAEMPLVGDLDIATSKFALGEIVKAFNNSSKWLMFDSSKPIPKTIKPLRIDHNNRGLPNEARLIQHAKAPKKYNLSHPYYTNKINKTNPYGNTPISKVISFRTINDLQVQLMVSKAEIFADNGTDLDLLEIAMFPARCVDLICCGLVMLRDGRVFEVVKNAYQDCKDKILRINYMDENTDINRLKERIEKLEKRGWKSEVNTRLVIRKINKLKAAKAKREKVRQKKDKTRQKRLMGEFYKNNDNKNKLYIEILEFCACIIVFPAIVHSLGGNRRVSELVNAITEYHGIKPTLIEIHKTHTSITTASAQKAKQILKDLTGIIDGKISPGRYIPAKNTKHKALIEDPNFYNTETYTNIPPERKQKYKSKYKSDQILNTNEITETTEYTAIVPPSVVPNSEIEVINSNGGVRFSLPDSEDEVIININHGNLVVSSDTLDDEALQKAAEYIKTTALNKIAESEENYGEGAEHDEVEEAEHGEDDWLYNEED